MIAKSRLLFVWMFFFLFQNKLNEDYQVLPDNDYYQNLSYTVKSPVLWEDLQNPVNRLLHTTGLRNFADAGITTATQIKGGTPQDSGSVSLIDIIGEKRVDTVSNFDFGLDLDATADKSRYIKFQNKRLSDYICLLYTSDAADE